MASGSSLEHGAPVDVVALGDGRYLLTNGVERRIAYAAAGPDATWVFLDGHVYRVEAPGRKGVAASEHAALSSPMPATVLRVEVSPGQRVSAGQTLVVLEAMKMELPLKAPRDATVKAVRCAPGELVQPGGALVELE